jgi:hypothetical protein
LASKITETVLIPESELRTKFHTVAKICTPRCGKFFRNLNFILTLRDGGHSLACDSAPGVGSRKCKQTKIIVAAHCAEAVQNLKFSPSILAGKQC